MSIILASAQRISADFGTMGAQQFIDAERDLRTLRDTARLFVRQGLDHASRDDVEAIKAMIDEIDERREAWAARLTESIATRYPNLTLEWGQGTDATVHVVGIEMQNIGSARQVEVAIDGVEHTVGNDNVRLDGETLIIENTFEETILELHLKEVAAFGFVDIEGTACGWTGFNLLTLDDRLITLR